MATACPAKMMLRLNFLRIAPLAKYGQKSALEKAQEQT
jgi:hypothetical protein